MLMGYIYIYIPKSCNLQLIYIYIYIYRVREKNTLLDFVCVCYGAKRVGQTYLLTEWFIKLHFAAKMVTGGNRKPMYVIL